MYAFFQNLATQYETAEKTPADTSSGWFCIETAPFKCPRCDEVVFHLTAEHRIIVWPAKDDPALLEMAGLAQRIGRAPRVREYEKGLGEFVSWYKLEAMRDPQKGRYPAHYRGES